MFSLKTLLATATVIATAFAQAPIGFTSVPAVVIAGQTYNLTWGGGDGDSVTLTLREGDPADLSTIGIIATNVQGSSYLWTVSNELPTASDYALQITQGLSGINYSGRFSLVGGTGTSSISYSGYTSSTRAANSTTIAPTIITGGTAASMGTGTAMSRNTTFSSVSLTSTHTSTTKSGSTTASTTGSTGAATTVATTTSSSAGIAAPNTMASSAALVMGLFGAIMFLQ